MFFLFVWYSIGKYSEKESGCFMASLKIDLSSIKKTFSSEERMQAFIDQEKNKDFSLPSKYKDAFTLVGKKNHQYLLTGEGKDTIVYIPGGGFVSHPSYYQLQFALDMAKRTNARVVTSIYPKVPVYSRDAIVSAVKEEILDLQEHHSIYALVSDSAGSAIALSVLDELDLNLQAVVYLSPNIDLRYESPKQKDLEKKDEMLAFPGVSMLRDLYKGPYKASNPKISPVLLNQLKKVPALIVVGTHELMLHDARLLRDKYQRLQLDCTYHEVEGMMHDFMFYPIDQGRTCKEKVFAFLQKHRK